MAGKAIIFSAPSGSGKTTIVKHLLEVRSDLSFSVSATTRQPRPAEVDGINYYFLGLEEFKNHLNHDDFLEYEEVYEDIFYGTLKSELDRIWKEGKSVIFDVDVKGGVAIKRKLGDKVLSIFVKAPSLEIIEHRLRSRGTEKEEDVLRRLAKVKEELKEEKNFDMSLINDDLSEALVQAEKIVDEFISANQ